LKPSSISNSSASLLDNFRNPEIARRLLGEIRSRETHATLMEVCGTHTMALFATGVRQGLPEHIHLASGPGCPVCVTPLESIERAIGLACRKDTVLFCFGDMVRVPGASDTLESARANRGARVRIMYSPLDALEFARNEPRTDVVLFGVGFETTIPLFASVVQRAAAHRITNLYLLTAFKLIPPAVDALLSSGDIRIDGFILPGHVSSIIGEGAYRFMVERYHVPGVIAGFEAVDLLEGILLLLDMISRREPAIKNQYARFVSPRGNQRARDLIASVFTECDSTWRGLGKIRNSGMRLTGDFSRFDAEALIDFEIGAVSEPAGCSCGDVLAGKRTPTECALFRSACTPAHPVGPCMVSREGACAAYYCYGGR
jgi:hydrogenase expression/formation protein HypD